MHMAWKEQTPFMTVVFNSPAPPNQHHPNQTNSHAIQNMVCRCAIWISVVYERATYLHPTEVVYFKSSLGVESGYGKRFSYRSNKILIATQM